MKLRIGLGYDVHRLKDGRKMILGGVEIPSNIGPDGHSDADVLLHAICDSILGALGLRDIGHFFPNTDVSFKDADSRDLLKEVYKLCKDQGYKVNNLDCMLNLQQPKVGKHIDAMKSQIASILEIDVTDIGLKATTGEEIGFVGRSEGVEAQAVVLLIKE